MEFTFLHVVFLAIAAFTLLCGLGVVVSRNLFHSAIWLVGAFAGVAGLYWLLEAEYMGHCPDHDLYRRDCHADRLCHHAEPRHHDRPRQDEQLPGRHISAVVAALLFVLLGFILLQVDWPVG